MTFEALPSEVQGYHCELEMAVYDAKQQGVITRAFALTGIGALIIFLAYRGLGWLPPLVDYVAGSALIAFAWLNCSREWKKNADGLWIEQKGRGIPFSRTDEKLQENWELDEISRFRKRSEIADDDLR